MDKAAAQVCLSIARQDSTLNVESFYFAFVNLDKRLSLEPHKALNKDVNRGTCPILDSYCTLQAQYQPVLYCVQRILYNIMVASN